MCGSRLSLTFDSSSVYLERCDAVVAEPEAGAESDDEAAEAAELNPPANRSKQTKGQSAPPAPAAADDPITDPLANRLEVADAEKSNTLQASRDQPTKAVDMADIPASEAAAVPAVKAKTPRKARHADGRAEQRASRSSQRSQSSSERAQKLRKKEPKQDPIMTIPPDSGATPAGIPQPTLRGRPISPEHNVGADESPPSGHADAPGSATEAPSPAGMGSHQAETGPDSSPSNRLQHAPTPGSISQRDALGGDVLHDRVIDPPEVKQDTSSLLGDLDFSGLAGVNVFKKRGPSPGKAAAPSHENDVGSRPPGGSKLQENSLKQDSQDEKQDEKRQNPHSPDVEKAPMQAEPVQMSMEAEFENKLGAEPASQAGLDKLISGTGGGSAGPHNHAAKGFEDEKMPDVDMGDLGAAEQPNGSSKGHQDTQQRAKNHDHPSLKRQAASGHESPEDKPDPEGILAGGPSTGPDDKTFPHSELPPDPPGPLALAENAQVRLLHHL